MKKENLQIVSLHLEAENTHDFEGTLATLHQDCLFEDIPLKKVYSGRQAAGDYYRLWWNAFDLITKSELRHWSEDGSVLIAEPRYIGTHVGDFYGIKATGKLIDIKLAVIISFRDGLLSGERFYWDTQTLLSQLGATHFPKLQDAYSI